MAILLIIACISLGWIILIQNSKGGGLTAKFASQNRFYGVGKTKNYLEKITWAAASIFLLLCLFLAN